AGLLDAIRGRGYEVMVSEQTRGVWNLSVPILGPGGEAIAAFTCPYLERLDKAGAPDLDAVLPLVITAGRDISQISGWGAER
ncbi:IclR family transcriptional regulator C-terminal domain-containing protein, partial [Acinetobacter baumannii]